MFSRTSRILLALALLLVGAYLAIELPRQRNEQKSQARSDRLASFSVSAIDSIVIERPGDTLVFAKADSVWRMTAPLGDSAEPGAIGSLLDALGTAEIDRSLGPGQDLAPYGLDHPGAVITLASAHRVVLQVAVGKNTVDDAWCYARTTSGDVLLVPTDVHHSSTLPLDAYRDHRVVNFQLHEVDSYSLAADGHETWWARRGHGWFTEVSPGDTIAGDSVGVEAVLRRLRGLRVASFVPPGGADTMRVGGGGSIRVSGTGGAALASLLFEKSARRVWRVTDEASGRKTILDDDVSDLFAHTTTELRDRRLIQFNPVVAQRIRFYSPTTTGELVRTGGRWSFPNPAMGRVDPEHAANFVRALRALKWTQPGGEAARTGAHAQYRIEIVGEGDRMIEQLTAGPYDATTRWVASLSSRGTWLIDAAALDELSGRFARLKQR